LLSLLLNIRKGSTTRPLAALRIRPATFVAAADEHWDERLSDDTTRARDSYSHVEASPPSGSMIWRTLAAVSTRKRGACLRMRAAVPSSVEESYHAWKVIVEHLRAGEPSIADLVVTRGFMRRVSSVGCNRLHVAAKRSLISATAGPVKSPL
jgi:hypothetical protein